MPLGAKHYIKNQKNNISVPFASNRSTPLDFSKHALESLVKYYHLGQVWFNFCKEKLGKIIMSRKNRDAAIYSPPGYYSQQKK